jgi:hypothetical protein
MSENVPAPANVTRIARRAPTCGNRLSIRLTRSPFSIDGPTLSSQTRGSLSANCRRGPMDSERRDGWRGGLLRRIDVRAFDSKPESQRVALEVERAVLLSRMAVGQFVKAGGVIGFL